MEPADGLHLDGPTLLDLYRQLVRIRSFEEQVLELFTRAVAPGITHVSIGQEAVAAGVCAALRRDDYITSTHRGHGHCLAKGARPDRMFSELLGKADGYCHGKGGSMHIADPDTGNLGANAIVGGSLAIAAGAALSAKRRQTDQVVACFFGDGALNQGLLLESMNMAALWQLPVVYVCENNRYGEYTRMEDVTAGDVCQRGESLGVTSRAVDGMDVRDVYEQALSCVARAREGGGPSLLICETYRYLGHGMSDLDRPYRTREEEETWRERDAIASMATYLIEDGAATQAELDEIGDAISSEMAAAVAHAKAAPFPSPAEVTEHLYGT